VNGAEARTRKLIIPQFQITIQRKRQSRDRMKDFPQRVQGGGARSRWNQWPWDARNASWDASLRAGTARAEVFSCAQGHAAGESGGLADGDEDEMMLTRS
jgi:hypothetical protein